MIGPIYMVTRLHKQVINISPAIFRDSYRQEGCVNPTGKGWRPPRLIKLALRPEAPALLFQNRSGRLHASRPPEFSLGIFTELWYFFYFHFNFIFSFKRLWLWDLLSGISDWSLLAHASDWSNREKVRSTPFNIQQNILKNHHLPIVHGRITLGCLLLCNINQNRNPFFAPILCTCSLCLVHFPKASQLCHEMSRVLDHVGNRYQRLSIGWEEGQNSKLCIGTPHSMWTR